MAHQSMHCEKCKHSREIPGDCHLKCEHPRIAPINLLALLKGKEAVETASFTLGIKLYDIGWDGGWAMWPLNFDPIWIQECKGFEEK